MADSRVKEIRNPYDLDGHIIRADFGAKLFLQKEGPKTLDEIKDFLALNGASYTKMGLSQMLDRMKRSGIRRHRESLKSDYTYYVSKKGLEDIGFQANLFARELSEEIFAKNRPMYSDNEEKLFLTEFVEKLGFYVIYNIIQGRHRALTGKSYQEYRDILELWLKNTLRIPGISFYFDRSFNDLIPAEQRDLTKSIYEDENKKKKLFKLEKILMEMYPEEANICKEVMSDLYNKTEKKRGYLENKSKQKREEEKLVKKKIRKKRLKSNS